MTNTTPPAITPVKGNWSEQKTKLKAQFTTLTDADLNYADGKKDEMMNNLQIKLGKTKDELTALIAAL
jgi:uncharacterized protein YjbJ (UPF0337 family)